MKIEYFVASNKGKVRAANEDSFAVGEKGNIWIVCDGMGGGVAGKFASDLTTRCILKHISDFGNPENMQLRQFYDRNLPLQSVCLAEGIQLANRLLFNLSMEYPRLQGMGTTVCSLFLEDNTAYLAHAGDSRIYSFKNSRMHLLTKDHSFVMELLEDKEISKKEAAKFKQKNVITRALGAHKACDLDLYIQPVTSYTKYFLLCTDGLWNVVSDSEIEAELQQSDGNPEKICNSLIDLANAKGGPDNITVAFVKLLELDKSRVGGAGNLQEKTITISNRDKSFLKTQDKVLMKSGREIIKNLPIEILKERSREILTNVLMYSALSLAIIGILFLIKIKLQLTP